PVSGVSAARRFSRHVSLRARKSLREQKLPGLSEGAPELSADATVSYILLRDCDLNKRWTAAMFEVQRDAQSRHDLVEDQSMRQLSRRTALALGAASAALGCVGSGRPASAAAKEAADQIAQFTGGKTAEKGKVTIELPEIAENGNTVPL